MFTVAELTAAMYASGRSLTPRTARNWWSIGLLPRPARTGLGRGVGTVTFWRDRQVLAQAQIAHDLLDKRASLQGTAAGLWLVGFQVPIKVVRKAFARQIAGHYRRGRGRSRDNLEAGLWGHVGRLVGLDARIRHGSKRDEEAAALYDLTGELLELLCGVGDGMPQRGETRQWAVDTAGQLMSQIETLSQLGRLKGTSAIPAEQAEMVEEVVTWISETASLRRQRDAVKGAQPHDWTRARRLTRMAIGLLDRGDAVASPLQHEANRALFTRLAATWARLLFPIVLAAVRKPEQLRSMTATLFAASKEIRRSRSRKQLRRGTYRLRRGNTRTAAASA